MQASHFFQNNSEFGNLIFTKLFRGIYSKLANPTIFVTTCLPIHIYKLFSIHKPNLFSEIKIMFIVGNRQVSYHKRARLS